MKIVKIIPHSLTYFTLSNTLYEESINTGARRYINYIMLKMTLYIYIKQ